MAVFDLNDSFNGTGGGEGPARAALALIFDTSDGAFRNPVEGAIGISTNTERFKRGHAVAAAEFGFVPIVHNLEFGRG